VSEVIVEPVQRVHGKDPRLEFHMHASTSKSQSMFKTLSSAVAVAHQVAAMKLSAAAFLPPVDFIKMKGEKIAQALSAVI